MKKEGQARSREGSTGTGGGKPDGMSRALSARQISEDLGVSASTVTRAFNPAANVAPRTRDKILSYAKSIGYRPNVFASTLNTQRTRIATILISDFYNPFFAEALVTLTEELQNAGLSVMLYHVPPGRTPDDTLPEALRYRPEYIVVMTATVTFQRAIAGAAAGTHLIFFNRYVPDAKTFSVTCDNRLGGRELADFLIRTGHRRMAYIAGTPGATTSIDRGRGFCERCAAAGLKVIEDDGADSFSYENGRAAAHRLLARDPEIDAIFCANDLMALGTIDGLRFDLGMKVPEQVSVVGFDDVAMACWPSHSLTTYRHPTQRMAQATVELIKEIDVNPSLTPVAVRVPGQLVPRGTHIDRAAAATSGKRVRKRR
jgi:DNA-binding LacI/PurR family transcriptional regulator